MKVFVVNSAGGSFCWNYVTDTFYSNYAGDKVHYLLHLCRSLGSIAIINVVLSVTTVLVDLFNAFTQVTVSAVIMLLKVSVALILVTVFAANIRVTIFIVIMQIAVSFAIMLVVFSATHYAYDYFYCSYAREYFSYSYVGDIFK